MILLILQLSALWDFFCFNIAGTTAQQSRGALSILCMAAKTSNSVLSSHLQDIIDIGFGRWAKVEPLLARTACLALQRLSEEDRKKLLSTNGTRVFSILESLVTGFWLPEHIWYAAADRAIATIYAIQPYPDKMAAELVKKSLSSVFDCTGGDELQNGGSNTLSTVQVTKLSRLLFVVSHVALNQLVYIESWIRKIQKDKAKREKIIMEDKGDCTDNTGPDKVIRILRHIDHCNEVCAHFKLQMLYNIFSSFCQENGINAELGLASSEDAFLDTLSERAEKEIVSGRSCERNLIGHCAPFLSKLCRNYSLMQKVIVTPMLSMFFLSSTRTIPIPFDFCFNSLESP